MTLNRPEENSGIQDEAVSSLGLSLASANITESVQETTNNGVTSFGDVHSVSGKISGPNDYEWKGSSAGFSSFSEKLVTGPRPPTHEDRARGESIDLFLSQSPSRTLGNDLLNFGNKDSAKNNSGSRINSAAYGLLSNSSHGTGIKKDVSPSGSVTGTSSSTGSRSQSPSQLHGHLKGQYVRGACPSSSSTIEYDAHLGLAGRRNISHASLNSTDDTYDARPHRLQPNHGGNTLSYAGVSSGRIGEHHSTSDCVQSTPILFPMQQQQQSVYHTSDQNQSQQQQQVFYMAVATHDGRQVLQPVQVVQIPGQASPAVVLPTDVALSPGACPVPHQLSVHGSGPIPTMMHNSQGQYVVNMSPSKKYDPRRSKPRPSQHGYLNRLPSNSDATKSQLQYNNNSHGPRFRSEENDFSYSGNMPGAGLENLSHSKDGIQHFSNEPYSHRSTPANSRGPSPRSSPTPNDAIATLYAAPQRPPLEELLGNVRRLSRDQVGCRLLQQALDEEGPLAATTILEEGLSFWGEAMVDPFGNYLFQKILEKVTPPERIVLVRSVSARLVNASLNLHGTRSVQKVVELCAADEALIATKDEVSSHSNNTSETAASILTKSLTPAAARLCIDSHGNHVIQRILLKLPQEHSHFVFEAVAESVGDVARHRHGCCVIQRCLDSPVSDARSHLVYRIVEKALELMQDAYGNYVVQYVLDVCGDKDVHVVCESVVGRINSLAIQKFSSNVVEKCLERCTDKVREKYLDELSDPDRIRELMMDPFGNYVIQRALSVATHAQATRLVGAIKPHLLSSHHGGQSCAGLRNTAGGRRILAKICRRFPNFNLELCEDQQQMYQAPPPHLKHGYGQNTHVQMQGPMHMNLRHLSPSPAKRRSVHGNETQNKYYRHPSRQPRRADNENSLDSRFHSYQHSL